MGKEKRIKTNALRRLDAAGVAYKTYAYDAPEGFLDGISVAKATGLKPERVFKTLVSQGASKNYYVCVIPVACELNLKKAAKHFGEKSLAMIPARKITEVTGYIKGGCSPIGMKKKYATVIDKTAERFESIAVSAGRVGLQMEVSLKALCQLAEASLADLTDAVGMEES